MKDILIVALTKSSLHLDICSTMTKEAKESGVQMQQQLETTWLLSGPKSFGTANRLLEIAADKKLPVAVFEIESVLSFPIHDESDVVRQT